MQYISVIDFAASSPSMYDLYQQFFEVFLGRPLFIPLYYLDDRESPFLFNECKNIIIPYYSPVLQYCILHQICFQLHITITHSNPFFILQLKMHHFQDERALPRWKSSSKTSLLVVGWQLIFIILSLWSFIMKTT